MKNTMAMKRALQDLKKGSSGVKSSGVLTIPKDHE